MKLKSVAESIYSDNLALEVKGKREAVVPVGRIDVLTSLEVIEVKHVSEWKCAVGQAILYGAYFPQHGKRIHLFGETSSEQRDLIEIACNKVGVRVTWAISIPQIASSVLWQNVVYQVKMRSRNKETGATSLYLCTCQESKCLHKKIPVPLKEVSLRSNPL